MSLANRRSGCAVLLCLLTTASNAAAETLESHVAKLAEKVAAVCKEDGYNSVVIEFKRPRTKQRQKSKERDRRPALPPNAASQVLSTMLAEELTSKHVEVRAAVADVELVGEVIIDEFGDAGGGDGVTGIALDVKVSFIGRDGTPILKVRDPWIAIEDTETLSRLLGVPFDESADERGNSTLVAGFAGPAQRIEAPGLVRAASNGKFAIQILKGGEVSNSGVLRNANPTRVFLESGTALVELDQNDAFSVKLINNSDFEVAVQLTLDGIDSFHFTKQKAAWIIEPHSSRTINGWQVDGEDAQRFRVFPYEESLAGKLDYVESRGVIQAQFHRSWKPNDPIPPGEKGRARSVDGIGAGERIVSKTTTVLRRIGRVRASIPVRYVRQL